MGVYERFKGKNHFYETQISINKKLCGLGCYQDKMVAAWVYNQVAMFHYGKDCKINAGVDKTCATHKLVETINKFGNKT